jgi:hypothetical protein
MSNKFIRLTSGWIPVSVLLLCAAALIAGQARANLPAEHRAAGLQAEPQDQAFVLETRLRDEIHSLRLFVATFLDLHDEIEVTIDATIRLPEDAPPEPGATPWRPGHE